VLDELSYEFTIGTLIFIVALTMVSSLTLTLSPNPKP